MKVDANIFGNPLKVDNTGGNATTETIAPPPQDELKSLPTSTATATTGAESSPLIKALDEFRAAVDDQSISSLRAVFDRVKDEIEPKNRELVHSIYYFDLAKLGDSEGLEKLIALPQENPDWGFAYRLIVAFFDRVEDKKRAHDIISGFYRKSNRPVAQLVESHFELVADLEGVDALFTAVTGANLSHLEVSDQARIYCEVADKFNKLGRKDLFVAFNERALTVAPNYNDKRFRFAYDVSEVEHIPKWLARSQYKIITGLNPKYGSAMNNLAASYDSDSDASLYSYLMWEAVESSPNQSIGNLAIHAANAGLFESARQLIKNHAKADDTNYERVREAERWIEEKEGEARKRAEEESAKAMRSYQSLKEALVWPAMRSRSDRHSFVGRFTSSSVALEIAERPLRVTVSSVGSVPDRASLYAGFSGQLAAIGNIAIGSVSDSRPATILTLGTTEIAIGFVSEDELICIFDFGAEAQFSRRLTRGPLALAAT